MSTRQQRINPLVAGLIAGLVIAFVVGVMAKINLDFAAPWAKTHTLVVQVSDADGIAVSSDVRIAGRLVGQVTGVRSQGSYSDVTLHIDDSEWPLPQDSTASIRLATLLGQKYVEIQPGHSHQYYADEAVVPTTKTQPVVDFDQILDTFDKPTRDALTRLIRTAGSAVRNQEGVVQNLIPDLRQLSADSVRDLQTLANNDGHLNGILVDLGVVADQLARSRDDLAGVIDNLNGVTAALASNQDALRGQIRNGDRLNQLTDQVLGGGSAGQLAAGLQRLNGVAHQLDALLAKLIPESNGGFAVIQDEVNLIYRIGDATSQSDVDGYFLRQYAQGVDTLGLSPQSSSAAASSGAAGPPSSPPVPGLRLPLPTLPLPLPQLPQLLVPGLNGIFPGGNGGTAPGLPKLFGGTGVLGDWAATAGGNAASLSAFLLQGGMQ